MNKKFGKILAEISAGELIDKITILEIKLDKISDKIKINDVSKELVSLQETMQKYFPDAWIVLLYESKYRIRISHAPLNKKYMKAKEPASSVYNIHTLPPDPDFSQSYIP